jgi:protein O-GlcNAc transferase
MQQGMQMHRSGDLAGAERAYSEALRAEPRRFDILHLLGMLAVQRKDAASAVDFFRRAVKLAPQTAGLHVNLGNALTEAKRFDEAIESLDRALQLEPGLADAWNSRGAALRGSGALGLALDSYQRAAGLDPNNVNALCNLGGLLLNLGQAEQGQAAYARAAAIAPNFAEAFSGLARAQVLLDHPMEAVGNAERAISLRPGLAEAHANRGFALETLGRDAEAKASYERARSLDPDLPLKFLTRGLLLTGLGRTPEALVYYNSCLALDPTIAEAHRRIGQEWLPQDPARALESLETAMTLEPSDVEARNLLFQAAMQCCDWDRSAGAAEALAADVAAGNAAGSPFALLSLTDSPSLHRKAAEVWARQHFPAAAKPLARGPYNHDRLRVGYVSADFHLHATSILAASVFELHDRSRIEAFAIAIDPAPDDPMRERLRRGFEHYLDVVNLDDDTIAAVIREREIDILVDLKGFTVQARTGVFARRPAPLQVSWLGYPGSMGAPYYDYILADAQVIPARDEHHYSEAVVRLPGSYQPNDPGRPIGEQPHGRTAFGLPAEGFVFCCFNAAYKITPEQFGAWMRILQAVEGSVLWLLAANDAAQANLVREAQKRGIDPSRLVFAPRVLQDEHLARQAMADLFLDTLPYGAHTTASDALWGGLPVLTRFGESFPSRVGASLLSAVGLPELITRSAEEYEASAVALARDPARLAALREKLTANRRTCALFDSVSFARHLESAFETMQARKREGRAPRAFDVEPCH